MKLLNCVTWHRFVAATMLLMLASLSAGCHHKRVHHSAVIYHVAQPDDHDFNGDR